MKGTKLLSAYKERIVATISTTGRAMVYDEKFMPYDLYFDMEEDIDTLLNNLNNFIIG